MEEDNVAMDDGSTYVYEAGTMMCDRNAFTHKTMKARPHNGAAGARSSGIEGSNPTCGKAMVRAGPCADHSRPSMAMHTRSHAGEHKAAERLRRTRRRWQSDSGGCDASSASARGRLNTHGCR